MESSQEKQLIEGLLLDDEDLLDVPSVDWPTPFVLKASEREPSPFKALKYPTQGGGPIVAGHAGELRGLFGTPGALLWHPEWSTYLGPREKPHWGVDIYARVGTLICATCDGYVTFHEGKELGLFATLKIFKPGNWVIFYGHMSERIGRAGKRDKGEPLGRVGCSGNADDTKICSKIPPEIGFGSSHVHIQVMQEHMTEKRLTDPLKILNWKLALPRRPPIKLDE